MQLTQTWEFPTVDPADLWNMLKFIHEISAGKDQPILFSQSVYKQACSPGANARAVWARASMVGLMEKHGLLKEWTHNGQVEGFVIQVMAEILLEPMKPGVPYVGEYDKILNEISKAATYLSYRKSS